MGHSIESQLDEMGWFFDAHVEGMFDALNIKIDHLVEQIRDVPARGKSEDSTPFDIQEGTAEAGIYDIPIAGDDWLIYVTPVIEVHLGVFVDENWGDTVHVVTNLLLRVKTRVRKSNKALCTPYTIGE